MSITPYELLLRLIDRGHRPGALIGDWFGHQAIVAVDLDLLPCHPDELFPADGAWYFGYRPYSGPPAQARAPLFATLDDGHWSIGQVDSRELTPALRRSLEDLREALTATPNASDDDSQSVEAVELAWDNGDQQAHRAAVASCQEAIRAGEVYQTCISTRFHAEVPAGVDPLRHAAAWFSNRARHYQPARAAFLPGNLSVGIPIIASLSPEEFLVRRGPEVRESPIKGTLPLHRDSAELLHSEKDVAENIMIVDLVRHDLGQVALTGSVRVTDLLSVRPAPGVWHLFSTVAATLPPHLPHAQLIEACFPPASVTGTPKLRAASLIAQWEPEERGVHCGAIGACHGEDLELNVAIRTAEYELPCPASSPGAAAAEAPLVAPATPAAGPNRENPNPPRVRVSAGIGGGITIASTASGEWAEIQAKAAPLLRGSQVPRPD